MPDNDGLAVESDETEVVVELPSEPAAPEPTVIEQPVDEEEPFEIEPDIVGNTVSVPDVTDSEGDDIKYRGSNGVVVEGGNNGLEVVAGRRTVHGGEGRASENRRAGGS